MTDLCSGCTTAAPAGVTVTLRYVARLKIVLKKICIVQHIERYLIHGKEHFSQ